MHQESEKMYLEDIEGYADDYVHKVSQCQTGNEGVRPVPHALVLVYNPQQGGVADQTDHKHQNGNHGVDVPEVVLDFSTCSKAHWMSHRRLLDRSVWRYHSLSISPLDPQVGTGTVGAVEIRRLEGGVDESVWERALVCFSPVYLAHSSGCHTGH